MIHVEGLTKYYGAHAAIRDLAFTITKGEVVGFLGLNGAGKTTTLKVLGCVLLPTSGRVRIEGFDVVENPHDIRRRIGFLPDTPPIYEEMTVGDYLSFVAQLRGVPRSQARARVEEAEERTALGEVDRVPIRALSHGFRQRVGVAQALVHRPALLVLDEPSSGLDPAQIVEMRSLLRGLRGEHTVLVSSHILSEISQTCDRLLVIQAGKLVAQGTEEELAQRLGGGGFVSLDVVGPAAPAVALLSAVPGVLQVTVQREEEGVTTLRVDAPAELRPVIARALVMGGVELLRLERGTEQLESIFLKLTHGREAA
ncbi:MAG: ABC transporter ATP-binding protein [Myxococcaceae bacterium]|nr:ABC transporter ATP-binding protein [Myxococcaceae bacterium]MCI0673070.1 ABC transporter ATP-binding protein [Myxococcaceae bacterium]